MRAVARIDQVSVAVDQAGRNPAAVKRNALPGVPAGWKVSRWAGERDAAVLRGDRAAFDHAEAGAVGRQGRETGVKPDGVEGHHAME